MTHGSQGPLSGINSERLLTGDHFLATLEGVLTALYDQEQGEGRCTQERHIQGTERTRSGVQQGTPGQLPLGSRQESGHYGLLDSEQKRSGHYGLQGWSESGRRGSYPDFRVPDQVLGRSGCRRGEFSRERRLMSSPTAKR